MTKNEKQKQKIPSVGEDINHLELSICWWEYKLVQALQKILGLCLLKQHFLDL